MLQCSFMSDSSTLIFLSIYFFFFFGGGWRKVTLFLILWEVKSLLRERLGLNRFFIYHSSHISKLALKTPIKKCHISEGRKSVTNFFNGPLLKVLWKMFALTFRLPVLLSQCSDWASTFTDAKVSELSTTG